MTDSQRFLIEVDSDAGIDSEQIKVAVENIGGDVIVERMVEVSTKPNENVHRLMDTLLDVGTKET